MTCPRSPKQKDAEHMNVTHTQKYQSSKRKIENLLVVRIHLTNVVVEAHTFFHGP